MNTQTSTGANTNKHFLGSSSLSTFEERRPNIPLMSRIGTAFNEILERAYLLQALSLSSGLRIQTFPNLNSSVVIEERVVRKISSKQAYIMAMESFRSYQKKWNEYLEKKSKYYDWMDER